jgi:glycosyltransferase involved in cell wall biosynthesis
MTTETPKIVVITPVKNEEWILERFLSVTSQFADHIIIADQNSTDASINICKQYPKVTLISNPGEQYDEASRQVLLLNFARELVPEHKIILALDSDEILAANAIHTLGWQSMLKAKPGTVLCFEKPDLYQSPFSCIRYETPWPIGYVDDGVEHKPKKIHSIRIPRPDYAQILHIHDVKVLHYGLTRMSSQISKMRFYSVLENVFSTTSVFLRRLVYSSNKDYKTLGKLESSPKEWFTGWEQLGIDMFTIQNQKYYWYDYEVLRYFHKYGTQKFWLDDIWNFDWESFRVYAQSIGVTDIPNKKLSFPPRAAKIIASAMTNLYSSARKFR